ncbi:MAG: protease inhibitor I42 family protein [Lentisphaeria bacterium]|nr:protease inhibitor I42 family protein [Lentisphaeria bacterium]
MKMFVLLALTILPLLSVTAAEPATAEPQILAIRVEKDRKGTINLQENTTTGFRWMAKYDSNLCKVEITHRGPENPGDTPLCGAPGRAIITVTLLTDTPADLTLEYRRPWEKDTPPAKILYYAVMPATGVPIKR